MTKTRKKLIEVALPLEAINSASAREKSIRHGHPSTLHLWWARRPLAAARAVIFAQMVDDPSSWPDLFPTEKKQDKERHRLFKIIEDLVQWENTTNEEVLQRARDAIWESWRRACADNADHPNAKEIFNRTVLPGFHDPFAGGGALPLEAQRLGLQSYASDLNPVPVLINKSMIEVPPEFFDLPPINPGVKVQKQFAGKDWQGTEGLAEDVSYYGEWMRAEAEKRIGHLYPKVHINEKMVEDRPDLKAYLGQQLKVTAWFWVRTVYSPNPAFKNVLVPLASTFLLSSKAGKEAYVEPIVNQKQYKFNVRIGKPNNLEITKAGTKISRANFKCLISGDPITGDYIKSEGKAGRLGVKMMALVAEGERGKIYISATEEMETIALDCNPSWRPDIQISGTTQYLGTTLYGVDHFYQLFSNRQLVALNTFSDLVSEVRENVRAQAEILQLELQKPISVSSSAYADAIALYLAFSVDRFADYWTAFGRWQSANQQFSNMFGRQAIAMVWDFPEANPFSNKGGSAKNLFEWTVQSIKNIGKWGKGFVVQADAAKQSISKNKVVSTDPPYYDNVPYADLSDFFYVWLRRSLKEIYPDLFSTLATPKSEELVAFAYRHNGKEGAEKFFLDGMTLAMKNIAEQSHPAFPVTIYYAFKQSENDGDSGVASTGWETFLESVIRAGFVSTGTWPIRTEMSQRMRGVEANALATSIVLVCRRRSIDAPVITRRDFLNNLKSELPSALNHLRNGNIAPVDLAQAAIGPGMAVFTRYSKVINAQGNEISVREALALINEVVDEVLSAQEGSFDAETRWALTWFDQIGFAEGDYDTADVLARAKGTAVDKLTEAGLVNSGRGKVSLIPAAALSKEWTISEERSTTVWENVHRLIKAHSSKGEVGASLILTALGSSQAEIARELCYRLYTLCERKKRAIDAMPYNALVQSWPEIVRLAQQSPQSAGPASDLFSQE
jgi:putative DNA methylase